MAKLQRDELQKFIDLTALKLDEQEKTALLNDLEQLLEYTAELQAVSLTDSKQSTVNQNLFRPDVHTPSQSELIRGQAPEHDGNYFVVPKIVDQDTEAQ